MRSKAVRKKYMKIITYQTRTLSNPTLFASNKEYFRILNFISAIYVT